MPAPEEAAYEACQSLKGAITELNEERNYVWLAPRGAKAPRVWLLRLDCNAMSRTQLLHLVTLVCGIQMPDLLKVILPSHPEM